MVKTLNITADQRRATYADIFAYFDYRKIKYDETATEVVIETIRNSADYKAWKRAKAKTK